MREVGTVLQTKGDYAEVKVDKKDACSKCGMCLFSGNVNHTVMSCVNKIGAQKDQQVVIDILGKGKLLGIFLVFIIPLILIGVSVLVSLLVIKNELWTILISIASVVLWYVLLIPIDKKIKKRSGFCPSIIEIIDKGEDENE